jgi:ComF family protein
MIINLLNLFFPKVCLGCKSYLGDNEVYLCITCRHQLPLTNFHFNQNKTIHNILYGRVQLEQATALLYFTKKGIVQELMHNLKYRGHEEIGSFLGQWLGKELNQIEAFKTIDVVIPVPLHKSKFKKRGYNQVSNFGIEIAKALQVNYNASVLQKITNTKTQVFKDRLMRTSETKAIFTVSDTQLLKGKHILLVDDIITTGATIEACAIALNTIENIKISIATMAVTS